MVLPLRVWSDMRAADAALPQLAHTIDISVIGGRLGGLRTKLNPGQTILLQRGQQRAPFRVIWNRELAPNENQAGVEALESGKNVWGVELPQTAAVEQSGWHTFAAAPIPIPIATRQPASETGLGQRLFQLVPHHRLRWGLIVGLLMLSGVLSLSVYREIVSDDAQVEITAPVPTPPTAADLARMTPKPAPPPLVEEVTTWSATPVPRVKVAMAPSERMVYPVSPNASLSGQVHLKILIAVTGRIKQIQVLGGETALVRAAEQAIEVWRYKPLRVKGRLAEAETNVVVNFRGADAVSVEFPGKSR
jgi:TonB family protein